MPSLIMRADGYAQVPYAPMQTGPTANPNAVNPTYHTGYDPVQERQDIIASDVFGWGYVAPNQWQIDRTMGENFYPEVSGRDQIRNAIGSVAGVVGGALNQGAAQLIRIPSIFGTGPNVLGLPRNEPTPFTPAGSTGGVRSVPAPPPFVPYGPSAPDPQDTGIRGPYGAPIGNDSGISVGNAADFAIRTLTNDYEDTLYLQQQELELDIAAIKSGYAGSMTELQRVLDELAGRGDLSQAAYGRYSAAVGAIDPSVTQAGIPDSDSPQNVERIYDDAQGVLLETLKTIDTSMGTETANAASQEMRLMEDFIQNSLRTDLDNVDNLHEAAGLMATRLSELAYADNLYDSAKQQTQLQAQIAAEIEDQRRALAQMETDMANAIDVARERARLTMSEYDPDYDEAYRRALTEYFQAQGLTDEDISKLLLTFDKIKDMDTTTMFTEKQWMEALSLYNNSYVLTQLGLDEEVNAWMASKQAIVDNAGNSDADRIAAIDALRVLEEVEKWLTTMDLGRAATGGNNDLGVLAMLGVISPEARANAERIGAENAQRFMVKGDEQWNQIRDMYTFERSFDRQWARITREAEENAVILNETMTNTSGTHSTAANNYENRNTEAYKYRREVLAPYYADLVKRAFAGTEIGGLGYIRPPTDVGGGRISNSDHQSGGAIDVYSKGGSAAQTHQQLLRMAAWFRNQPGVSYVTYEGQGAHQTGTSNAHVHVSFQTDYRIP